MSGETILRVHNSPHHAQHDTQGRGPIARENVGINQTPDDRDIALTVTCTSGERSVQAPPVK